MTELFGKSLSGISVKENPGERAPQGVADAALDVLTRDFPATKREKVKTRIRKLLEEFEPPAK